MKYSLKRGKKTARMNLLLTIYIVTVVLAVTLVVSPAILSYGEAEDPAKYKVVPEKTFKNVSDTFKVNVTLYNVVNLQSFEYKFKWNSTLINCTSYTRLDPKTINWGKPPAKADPWEFDMLFPDYHWFSIVAMAGATPFTGNLTLATYTFKVMNRGSCVLDLYDTKLGNSTGKPILHTVEDGEFSDPYPRASFTYSPKYPLKNENVTFNATASYDPDGTVVSYAWDFDDGKTGSGVVATNNYTANGAYNVTLTVTDNDGLTDTAWQVVKVGTVAAFTYSPKDPLTLQIVTFNATESRAAPPSIIGNFTWNFDDGNITIVGDDEPITPIINHTYVKGGIYNVTLTVKDTASLNDTAWQIVKVGRWPTAYFKTLVGTIETNKVLANQSMQFDAIDSYDVSPGVIVNYTWNFNDLNITTTKAKSIFHTYVKGGTYNVTLTVTDNETLTNSFSRLVYVVGYPVANFTSSPPTPKVGEVVTFNGSLSTPDGGSIVQYKWNFGERPTPNVTLVNYPVIYHIYTVAGTYNVTLLVRDSEAKNNSITKPITIAKANSTISISASPTTIKLDEDTTINGSITPKRVGVTVTIHYRLTGEAWDALANVTTDSNGKYSYTWTPDKAGTYEVKASWTGDASYLGAESSTVTITVKKAAAPPYLLYAAVVIVIIIVAAIAIYFLKIRKS